MTHLDYAMVTVATMLFALAIIVTVTRPPRTP